MRYIVWVLIAVCLGGLAWAAFLVDSAGNVTGTSVTAQGTGAGCLDLTAPSANTVSLCNPGATSSYTLNVPVSQAAGYLSNDGTGNLSWNTPSGGGGGGGSVAAGTFAALPGCSAAGSLYLFTNSLYNQALCNGSTWAYFANGMQVTPPPSTGWTADNCPACTFDFTNGYGYLQAPSLSGTRMSAEYRAAPATPYTVTAMLTHDIGGAPNGGQFQAGYGLVFRDSSGKLVWFEFLISGNAWYFETAKFTNSSTFQGNYTQYGGGTAGVLDSFTRRPQCLREADDGTNLTWSYSLDCQHWVQFDQRARSDFFSAGPTQIGFDAFPDDSQVLVGLLHWQAQ